MAVWDAIRRAVTGAALGLLFGLLPPAAGQDPAASPLPASRPTVAQLRARAEAAERAGDWETAFATYCQLFAADRTATDVRERLNMALRRALQLRRHRDPHYIQFVRSLSPADALKLAHEVFAKVSALYVDRERATPQALWQHGIDELDRALGSAGFRQAFLDGAATEAVDRFRTALRTTWARQAVSSAAEARTALRRLVSEAPPDLGVRAPAALVLEVVCGACSGLDEYTVYLNPMEFTAEPAPPPSDLTAYGLYLEGVAGEVVVAGVAPGSWAAFHTPLRKGDRVLRLNGRPLDLATPAALAQALALADDDYHDLEVAVGPDALPVLVRLPVRVPSVYGIGVAGEKEGIGYVRIGSFTASTARELDEAILALRNGRGVRVLILDVRGNPGGSFLAGVEAAKRFLPAGLIVTTQGQFPQVDNRPFSSDSGATAHDLPLVILVDTETASAAEVFAAALKDHHRATLVGLPTFGKGAVQYPVRLDSLDDKDAHGRPRTNRSGGVRLTIARLLSPGGAVINGVGVIPDVMEADPRRQLELAVEKATELLPLARSLPPMMPAPMPAPTPEP